MEDITLALITLTSFVLLFVVAIFADRAGLTNEANERAKLVPIDEHAASQSAATGRKIDVA